MAILSKKITVDVRGEILELKDTINTMVDQLRSFASEVTRVAREVGAEGKLGGQADVQGCRRHVEGFDRQREHDGRQSDRAGAQHRRGHDRDRERRSLAQDHGRCPGRDPRDEEHDQHAGGSAELVCLGSYARGSRSGLGRNSRRSGGSARRFRHVERSDRLGEFHGRQPDRAGAQHRPCYDRGREWRSLEKDHGRCEGRNRGAEEHRQHDGRSAQLVRLGSYACGARSGIRRRTLAVRPR